MRPDTLMWRVGKSLKRVHRKMSSTSLWSRPWGYKTSRDGQYQPLWCIALLGSRSKIYNTYRICLYNIFFHRICHLRRRSLKKQCLFNMYVDFPCCIVYVYSFRWGIWNPCTYTSSIRSFFVYFNSCSKLYQTRVNFLRVGSYLSRIVFVFGRSKD